MKKLSKFVKLVKSSDWGRDYLAVKGRHLTPSGSASEGLGLPFKDRQKVQVRFPDGHVEDVRIKVATKVNVIVDSGFRNEVESENIFFYVTIHGLKRQVGLHEVEVSCESIPTMRSRTARVEKPRQMTVAKRKA